MTNKQKAYLHFFPECNGKCRKGWVLHHKDLNLRATNPKRYNQWNIDDLESMTVKEHRKFHSDPNNQNYIKAPYITISRKAHKVIKYMQTKYPELLGHKGGKFLQAQIIDFALNEWLKHEVGINDEFINKIWLEEITPETDGYTLEELEKMTEDL